METINYKGKGEHSVNELELIIEQQAEELHLFKSGQKQLRLHLEEQPIETTEHYLFNTWIKGTEIVKTEKGDITVLEILNDFRGHLLQNIEHNKEAYHQKQFAIPVVSQQSE